MTSAAHQSHIASRVSYADCSECRADTERQFVQTTPWRYGHVAAYLEHVRPRLAAIRAGEDSPEARQWLRDFRRALDTRISLKVPLPVAQRKQCRSYLERLEQFRPERFRRPIGVAYLRLFAARGASCLDYR